ncbi:hypothetical protein AAG906_002790 [Vitis piasezkii]
MPCGIGELTLLQTLRNSLLEIGEGIKDDHEIGRLSELKGLNNLKGELIISKIKFKGEKYVQSLRLEWWYRGAQSSEDCESPMEGLQPHPDLKSHRSSGDARENYGSTGGLSTMLPNLITINLEGCLRCHTLPCFV